MVRSTTLFFLIFLSGFSFSQESKDIIICDAEKTEMIDGKLFFVSYNQHFNQGDQQTSQNSFTGEYSVAVNEKYPYGFTYEITSAKANQAYKISVWRKGKGALVVSAELPTVFYQATSSVKQKRNGWERLEYQFLVPQNMGDVPLKIYVLNQGKETSFFDDLTLEKLPNEIQYPEYNQKEAIGLIIDSAAHLKLNNKRLKAFEKGMLTTEKDSWVKGKLVYKGDTNKIKLRLKGDWLDHLQNDKWSFRIKMKDGHVLNRREFSLQNPNSRSFLDEWVFHKCLQQEDVLTTKYEFIPVYVNGRSLGIYAFEEHFEKELLEHQNRRESPMLKFDESGFWNIQLHELKTKTEVDFIYPFFNASTITPFGKKKVKKDSLAKILFEEGQNKLHAYQTFSSPVSEIFDVEKIAKFYALADVFKAHHALIWHNQRFYLNPQTNKLEPVVYDCFVNEEPFKLSGRPFLAYNLANYKTNYYAEFNFIYQAFNDSVFRKEYFEQLNFYLNDYNWKSFLQEINPEMEIYKNLLEKEFSEKLFSGDTILKRNASLKKELDSIKLDKTGEEWFGYKTFSQFKSENLNDLNIPNVNFRKKPFQGISLKVFTDSIKNKTKFLTLVNYHHYPISIIGYGEKNDSVIGFKKLDLVGYRDTLGIEEYHLKLPEKAKRLFYSVAEEKGVYSGKILNWKSPNQVNYKQDYSVFPFKTNKRNELVLHEGNYVVRNTIIIPPNRKVIINEGVMMDFVGGAGFISYSPIEINGTKGKNVMIKSSDSNNNGFSLIKAIGKSQFNYVVFDGLKANSKDVFNTGSVSIYQSRIEMDNCVFKNVLSEDGLNIIDAQFKLNNCTFKNCFSDALDVDFGKGEILNSKFYKIGNDAIDVSFSEVVCDSNEMSFVNDKGISCGEQSKVRVFNTVVSNVKVGVVIKDESQVFIEGLNVERADFGVVLFNKKSTFDSCKAAVGRFTFNLIGRDFLIDENSVLKMKEEIIIGKNKIDAKQFN